MVRLAIGATLLVSCTAPVDNPAIDRVEPARWTEGQAVEASVYGTGLHLKVVTDLTSPKGVRFRHDFQVRIGNLTIEPIVWVDNFELRMSVPPTLPAGSYDIEVTTPSGVVTSKSNAITIDPFVRASWEDAASVTRRPIAVDTAGITQPLTDFPLLVRLDGTRIDYASAAPGGADIRFYADAARLSHEVESWDPAGQSFLWVRIPLVQPGIPLRVHLYYGGGGASVEAIADVWRNGFAAVWHLHKAGPVQPDSTANGNDATAVGNPLPAVGAIGPGLEFNPTDGHDDSLRADDDPTLSNFASLTLQAWMFVRSRFERQQRVVQKRAGITAAVYGITFCSTGPQGSSTPFYPCDPTIEYRPAVGEWALGTLTMNDSEWTAVNTTYDIPSRTGEFWIDGISEPFATSRTTDFSVGEQIDIGGVEGRDERGFRGRLDEVRISNIARSASLAPSVLDGASRPQAPDSSRTALW